MAFELGPTRPFTTSRSPSSHTAMAFPLWAGVTLLLAIIQRKGHGYALGHHYDISLSSCCSTWHFKSMDISWACRASGPMMNSSVMSATSTQIHRRCHPRVSSTSASFKREWVFPLCHLQVVGPGQLSVVQSCDNVWPANNHRCPSVNGNKVLLVPYLALGI